MWANTIVTHEFAATNGPQKTKALAMFHAFTGCEVTSFLAGKGKNTAWDTWGVYPDTTDSFQALSQSPTHIPEDVMSILERFVVLQYDRSSDQHKVNDARQNLFARKSRALENTHLHKQLQSSMHCMHPTKEDMFGESPPMNNRLNKRVMN